MIKITFFTIALLASAIFAISRFFGNSSEKRGVKHLISKINKDASYAGIAAKELIQKYRSCKVPETFDLNAFMNSLQASEKIGHSIINFTKKLSENSYLLITTCHDDNNFDVGLFGSRSNERRTYNINYLLKLDKDSPELLLYSDPHRGGDLKALRSSFARKLMKEFELKV